MAFFKEELKKIKAFVFDVDGVLSLPSVSVDPTGELIRTACVKDGYAIMYCGKKGYIVAIISGGGGPGVRERFEKIGIKEIYLREADKIKVLTKLMEKYSLTPDQVMYMGDDIPDYECMKHVGVPVCPADACTEIKSIVKYISPFEGGKGCARDVIEQTLKAQDMWMDIDCHVRSM